MITYCTAPGVYTKHRSAKKNAKALSTVPWREVLAAWVVRSY